MQFEPDWVAVATNVPVVVLTQFPVPIAFAGCINTKLLKNNMASKAIATFLNFIEIV
jgi:hypothetical protein